MEVSGLADEEVRTIFAEGLVDVLKKDVRANDALAQKGLGERPLGEDTFSGPFEDNWKPKEPPVKKKLAELAAFGSGKEMKY